MLPSIRFLNPSPIPSPSPTKVHIPTPSHGSLWRWVPYRSEDVVEGQNDVLQEVVVAQSRLGLPPLRVAANRAHHLLRHLHMAQYSFRLQLACLEAWLEGYTGEEGGG